jgi:hypothetical protein
MGAADLGKVLYKWQASWLIYEEFILVEELIKNVNLL